MRTIGRIILLVVGIVMLAMSIPVIMESVKALQEMGITWENAFASERFALVGRIVGQGVDALFGIVALLGAIFGRKSIKLALCAIIMMIAPVSTLIADINAGTTFDFPLIGTYIGQFALPLAYALGFLLV